MHLGAMLDPDQVVALRDRADALALGTVTNDQVLMQRAPAAPTTTCPTSSPTSAGTLRYRKIRA